MKNYKAAMKAPRVEWNHMQTFTQACLGNGTTTSPFSVGGPLTQMLMLGVITQYLNKGFSVDPKKGRIIDNPKAQALLDGPPPRKGWEHYYSAG